MRGLPAFALLPLALLAVSCSRGGETSGTRPPWADGAPVTTVVPADRPPQNLGDFQRRILAIHNRERAAVGAAPLAWDPALAASAASYGPALAARGSLAHAPDLRTLMQGENLWMGTSGAFSIEEMVESWAAEKALLVPGTVPNVSRSGVFGDVGHYTQMIWRTTQRIGCALHRDGRADYLICRYSPPGNVVGQPVP